VGKNAETTEMTGLKLRVEVVFRRLCVFSLYLLGNP
jgi:hypothetical protein